ncbi:hypothetical protein GOP47_0008599 [Adiantum capillus-veneris]|uniref:3-dehydrosphinganine reductase n=1 Tax=Adiantum capillus-veneris TaxID=13818 RepID=A0A9D4UYW7_ADICA|nr:hypothetical protein GOP47_0008599 [Adiantum capillus-veneris]
MECWPWRVVVVLGVLAGICWADARRRRFKHIASLRGKHVVITGGSSGIGLSIAQQCAAEGAYLTLIARTLPKLEDARRHIIASLNLPTDSIRLKSVDVGNAEAVAVAIRDSFEWRPIDVLVCSAGILQPNFVEDMKPSRLEEVTRTNILGVMFPIQSTIPLMKTRSAHHPSSIVIVGSLSACVFLYGTNIYSPTKCALKGLAELLKFELLPYKIGVTLSCPSFTQTPMLAEAFDEAEEFVAMGEKIYLVAIKELPDDVARFTIEGFKRNEFFVSTTYQGVLVRTLGRGFVPPDSFLTLLVEVLLIVPLRILTFMWGIYAKHVLLTNEVPIKRKV